MRACNARAADDARRGGAAAPVSTERRIDLTIRFVLPGNEPSAEHAAGTLIVVRVEPDAEPPRYWLEELDLATMRAYHSKGFGSHSPIAVNANDVIYVLTSDADAQTHTVDAVEKNGFRELAASRVAGAVPERFEDRAASTGLTIGTRGALVNYRGKCPKGTPESEEGCLFYETHRLGDLAVVKVRHYAFKRMTDFSRPEIDVPDDCGEIPPAPEKEAPPQSTCPMHGSITLGAAWVGDRYFVATSGCCGGEHGGFFECDEPK